MSSKRGRAKVPPPSPKRGKTAAPLTPGAASRAGEHPFFCFRYVDRASKNQWAFAPTEADSKTLLTFLCEMAALTWREIEQQTSGGRRKHHDQAFESIATGAQKDATRKRLDRTFGDTLFRFRLGSRARLWGFRDGRVFHVVWWDWDHKVYPTEPN